MTGRLRAWWRNHWQAWTCLHGLNRVICIADDLAHMLHLSINPLCDLHDRRLMRTAGTENDLHLKTLRRFWDEGEPVELADEQVQLAELGTAIAYETWPKWWNTSTNTTTLGDVKVTYRSLP